MIEPRITINRIDGEHLRRRIIEASFVDADNAHMRMNAITHYLNWMTAAITRQRPQFLAGLPTNRLDLMLWGRRN